MTQENSQNLLKEFENNPDNFLEFFRKARQKMLESFQIPAAILCDCRGNLRERSAALPGIFSAILLDHQGSHSGRPQDRFPV